MAQQGTEAASALRDSGKIYVVVGVVLLIFIGLVIYLIRVDRKVKRLEEAQNDKSSEQ
jgi:beta-lactamase regulating signal transducer with metallopeptidase domain